MVRDAVPTLEYWDTLARELAFVARLMAGPLTSEQAQALDDHLLALQARLRALGITPATPDGWN